MEQRSAQIVFLLYHKFETKRQTYCEVRAQSQRVCNADSLAAESDLFGGFFI